MNKKKIINLTIISSAILISVLASYSLSKNNYGSLNSINSKFVKEIDSSLLKSVEESIENNKVTNKENTIQNNAEATNNKDEIVINYFNEHYDEIKNIINSENKDKLKQKSKETFITFVDFIFYDGEIKGIKYDELSDGIKEQLFIDFSNIDSLIVKYEPNYKEEVSDKYYVVKDYITPKYYKAVDSIKNYLGDEKLKKINDVKDTTKEKTKEVYEDLKNKIKIKYENYKEK